MGAACSTGALEGRAAEGSVKKKFRTVRSFGKKKKDDESDGLKSPCENWSGDFGSSFSGGSLSSTPRKSGDGCKRGSLLGKAGFERAVGVLDTFSSGVVNLNPGGFVSGMTVKGHKISVIAFEVANTIMKGATLMHSLSEENVKRMKEKVLCSEGIQRLVSSDVNVLLSIIAEDKREELNVFIREVVRFGDLCKDPQWHNLDRYFAKLAAENAACEPFKQEAELKMNDLINFAQSTSELYHELNALDRFEQDYRLKCKEAESLNLPRKGENFTMLQTEIKHQRKIVSSLKKKSLWCRRLEEVVEQLVDVIAFIHLKIIKVCGSTDVEAAIKEPSGLFHERLDAAGLALHYANIINQIDNIASKPTFLPPNVRDSLYLGLPNNIKTDLRINLKKCSTVEELTVPQINAEMERILEWLTPMAASTSKMYQGFGWIGEWASTSYDFSKQSPTHEKPIRLQTLYHADKKKTESYILELLKWLNYLICTVKRRDYEALIHKKHPHPLSSRSKISHLPSPVIGKLPPSLNSKGKTQLPGLTLEERNMVEKVSIKQYLPIVSKSQEFRSARQRSLNSRVLSQSARSSPCAELSRSDMVESQNDSDLEIRGSVGCV